MASKKPSRLLEKFVTSLSLEKSLEQRFIASILNPSGSRQAILWLKEKINPSPFSIELPLSWQPGFIDQLSPGQKPGSHELHQKGYYYCLDFSSVFEVALSCALKENVSRIIDLCASPGGKGIFLWRQFLPEQIIFNEVIRKRTAPLLSNLKRCAIKNIEVSNYDSAELACEYQEWADLVLVDAPCSGQSLRVRGKDAFGCFHPHIIRANYRRQRRIVANALKMIRPGGFLLYTTCTFSREENEEIISWLLEKNQDLVAEDYDLYQPYQSKYVDFPSYRLWPTDGLGAGGFCALLRRKC